MQEVNVYVYTNVKSMHKQDGAISYVLEVQTSKGLKILPDAELVEDVTEKKAQIIALTRALLRLNKPCILNIYTDSSYVASAYTMGWMERWKKDGWVNAKGKLIANCKEWTELDLQMRKHAYRFHLKQEHKYREQLKNEAEKKEMQGNV